MTAHSKKWFDNAIKLGIDVKAAYMGTEVIDSWSNFWGHEIPENNLEKMTQFALSAPDAALQRWSILAGPVPYVPHESLWDTLRKNPKYSAYDDLK